MRRVRSLFSQAGPSRDYQLCPICQWVTNIHIHQSSVQSNRNTGDFYRHCSRLLLTSLVFAVLLAGCGGSTAAQSELTGQINAVGSTALQPLVSVAASQFMELHPQVQIKVSGGDSTAGLNAVTTQQADIGDTDIYADRALYPDPRLTDHIVCIIPDAMVVNPDVTIKSLTQQQIISIFSTGQINNWSQVGGPDLPIVPVVQDGASGTHNTFQKYILGGHDEIGNLQQTTSSTNERDTVAQTPGAIGYLALSVLTPQVNTVAIGGQMPTEKNIVAGSYAFWSYEHMYTLGDTNSTVEAFLNFMLTPGVQQQAQKMNYLPNSVMMQAP